MRTITGLDELRAAEGDDLGTSDWHEVTQAAIDAFADVTGDHQWIHVDVERAKETPFGGTIAHGYYTLSLAPMFMEQTFAIEGFAFAVNYGLNRVRFPAPLPVGSRGADAREAQGARGHPRRRADDRRADVRARGRRQARLRRRDARAGLHRRLADAGRAQPPSRTAGPASPRNTTRYSPAAGTPAR